MQHEYNRLIAVHTRFQLAVGTSTASAGRHCQWTTTVKLEMRLRVQVFPALEYFARLPDGHPARLPLTIRSKNKSVDHCHLSDKINSPEESTRWPNDAG
jgi:hypothetical protein